MLTKKCTKCFVKKPLNDFHNAPTGKYGKRSDCKVCVRERQQRNGVYSRNPKNPCQCGNLKSKYSEQCSNCARPPIDMENPRWHTGKRGYVIARGKNRVEIRQHRFVMEKYLGRKLKKHENVHHKNGIRDDNRLENLEIWSTSQPSGQRVDDKIAWCKWFLQQYGE